LIRRIGRSILAHLPAFGFAAYPIVFLAGANVGVLPMEAGAIARSLTMALAGAAILVLGAGLLPWHRDGRIAWLSMILLGCALYQPIMAVAGLGGKLFTPDTTFPAAVFVLALAAIAAAVVRPWQSRPRSPLVLNAALAVLFVASSAGGLSGMITSSNKRWQPAVESQIERVLAHQSPPTPARDIYYFVLDGFGRPDVLRAQYDLDLSDFVDGLAANGVHVAASAHSNYAQTYLSLASTLNLTYLDDLAGVMGENARDRRPLKQLIDRNALMQAARRAGYRVYSIGSDYGATQTVDAADVCICDRHGFDELETAVLALTPFGSLPLGRWTYDAHRAKILAAFDAVDHLRTLPERKFVFVHMLAPHPPFVFAADGRGAQAGRPFDFQDGDHFRGNRDEYVRGYRDQVRYVARRLLTVVEHLTQQARPAPVVVIHGDHGPGSRLHWSSASESDLPERMAILAAYGFPGEPAPPDRAITPVNGARFLARRYLGLNTPPLPDASYFSTWDEPYRFIPVATPETMARE
jgi:Sulfatase